MTNGLTLKYIVFIDIKNTIKITLKYNTFRKFKKYLD